MKILFFFFFWGGGGGGSGRVGVTGGCEQRIEVFVKIHKKIWGGGVIRVDVTEK